MTDTDNLNNDLTKKKVEVRIPRFEYNRFCVSVERLKQTVFITDE